MIRDARVLQDDFLPQEVVHRHEEMNRLSAALDPVVDGGRPEDALVVGPSGAGKTCLARYAVSELEREADVETQYVDCWQHSSRFRILYRILEGVAPTYDIHRSTPRDELLQRIEGLETPYVVILDEVDQVADADILRELYGIPHVTTICIANRERDVVGPLDERLRSRLRSSVTVEFDAYSDEALVAILADRVKWGLVEGAVSERQLATIANAAAGNARDAISILRTAAREAEHEGSSGIGDAHIETSIPEAQTAVRQKAVQKLSEHQRVVYEVLEEDGPLSPKELYARYQSAVEEPRTKRTVRSYLGKLEQYNLVTAAGSGPTRVYSLVHVDSAQTA
jgi:orc1/cdc6 family replication initiation protein